MVLNLYNLRTFGYPPRNRANMLLNGLGIGSDTESKNVLPVVKKSWYYKNTNDRKLKVMDALGRERPSAGIRLDGVKQKTLNKQKNYGKSNLFSEYHHIVTKILVRISIGKIFIISKKKFSSLIIPVVSPGKFVSNCTISRWCGTKKHSFRHFLLSCSNMS